MKTVFMLLFLLFFLSFLYSEADQKKETHEVYFGQDVFTSKDIIEGEKITHTFFLLNRTKTVLFINRVKTDCRCTSVEFDKSVPPAEKGKIKLTVDTIGSWGNVVRKTAVYLTGPPKSVHSLEMRLPVTPILTVTPDRISFKGFPEDKMKEEITIKGNSKKPLELKIKSFNVGEKLKYNIKHFPDKNSYSITFKNLENRPVLYRGRLVMETGYPERPVIAIPIFFRILEDIQVTPKKVDLGTVNKARYLETSAVKEEGNKRFLEALPVLEKEILITDNRKKGFKIDSLEINSKYFKTGIKDVKGQDQYRIKITALIDNLENGLTETVLRFHTNSKNRPVIEVPVRIQVE